MKLIRMTKTLAGPGGTFPVGSRRTVSDAEAAALKAARACDILGDVPAEAAAEIVTPDKESAAVAGAPERAVAAKATPRKRAKKSTAEADE